MAKPKGKDGIQTTEINTPEGIEYNKVQDGVKEWYRAQRINMLATIVELPRLVFYTAILLAPMFAILLGPASVLFLPCIAASLMIPFVAKPWYNSAIKVMFEQKIDTTELEKYNPLQLYGGPELPSNTFATVKNTVLELFQSKSSKDTTSLSTDVMQGKEIGNHDKRLDNISLEGLNGIITKLEKILKDSDKPITDEQRAIIEKNLEKLNQAAQQKAEAAAKPHEPNATQANSATNQTTGPVDLGKMEGVKEIAGQLRAATQEPQDPAQVVQTDTGQSTTPKPPSGPSR